MSRAGHQLLIPALLGKSLLHRASGYCSTPPLALAVAGHATVQFDFMRRLKEVPSFRCHMPSQEGEKRKAFGERAALPMPSARSLRTYTSIDGYHRNNPVPHSSRRCEGLHARALRDSINAATCLPTSNIRHAEKENKGGNSKRHGLKTSMFLLMSNARCTANTRKAMIVVTVPNQLHFHR